MLSFQDILKIIQDHESKDWDSLKKTLLQSHFDVHSKNHLHQTFLMVVLQKKNRHRRELVDFFIEKGIDVEAVDCYQENALMHATRNNCLFCLNRIFEKDSFIDRKNIEGWTALHYAAFYGQYDALSFLIQHNASLNAVNDKGWNVLHYSVFNNFKDCTELFIQKGIFLDQQNDQGLTPLMEACSLHRYSTVRLLLNAGADFSLKNLNNETAYDLLMKDDDPFKKDEWNETIDFFKAFQERKTLQDISSQSLFEKRTQRL